ncbi:unnamed protein product [Rhizoctonia solani]|uniref:Uncharacterized protein n=1 Tax=Rhizoctonia solani TaxID=456999 RepID=A0A8H3DS42_9AGAM|nr:unnamed protein product [Rhizoctonia solani]CAE6536668.1 unnamed protein product [Rhizoctonia solani]
MLRRDPTPLQITEFDVEDVKKAMALRENNGQAQPEKEEPVNALDQARKQKEGKTRAQRIGLTQLDSFTFYRLPPTVFNFKTTISDVTSGKSF